MWFPGPPKYHGPEGAREFFRTWTGAFEEFGYEVEEVIDASDAVVVHLHQRGRGRGSGAMVENRFWQIYTFANGRVVHYRDHPTRAEALEAVELRE